MADNLLDNAREQNAGIVRIPSTESDYAVKLINGLVRKLRSGSQDNELLEKLILMIFKNFAYDKKNHFDDMWEMKKKSDYYGRNKYNGYGKDEPQSENEYIDADTWINKPNGMNVSPLQTIMDIDRYKEGYSNLMHLRKLYNSYGNLLNLNPIEMFMMNRKGKSKEDVERYARERMLGLSKEYDVNSRSLFDFIADRVMLDPILYSEGGPESVFGPAVPRWLINNTPEAKLPGIEEGTMFDYPMDLY